mgnify:CR=1 FL=1
MFADRGVDAATCAAAVQHSRLTLAHHHRPARRALPLVTRLTGNVRLPMATTRAHAVTTRPCSLAAPHPSGPTAAAATSSTTATTAASSTSTHGNHLPKPI